MFILLWWVAWGIVLRTDLGDLHAHEASGKPKPWRDPELSPEERAATRAKAGVAKMGLPKKDSPMEVHAACLASHVYDLSFGAQLGTAEGGLYQTWEITSDDSPEYNDQATKLLGRGHPANSFTFDCSEILSYWRVTRIWVGNSVSDRAVLYEFLDRHKRPRSFYSGTDNLGISWDVEGKLRALSFTGSTEFNDFQHDANGFPFTPADGEPGSYVGDARPAYHAGFWTEFKGFGFDEANVKKHILDHGGGLVLTGHSLGGALANIFSYAFYRHWNNYNKDDAEEAPQSDKEKPKGASWESKTWTQVDEGSDRRARSLAEVEPNPTAGGDETSIQHALYTIGSPRSSDNFSRVWGVRLVTVDRDFLGFKIWDLAVVVSAMTWWFSHPPLAYHEVNPNPPYNAISEQDKDWINTPSAAALLNFISTSPLVLFRFSLSLPRLRQDAFYGMKQVLCRNAGPLRAVASWMMERQERMREHFAHLWQYLTMQTLPSVVARWYVQHAGVDKNPTDAKADGDVSSTVERTVRKGAQDIVSAAAQPESAEDDDAVSSAGISAYTVENVGARAVNLIWGQDKSHVGTSYRHASIHWRSNYVNAVYKTYAHLVKAEKETAAAKAKDEANKGEEKQQASSEASEEAGEEDKESEKEDKENEKEEEKEEDTESSAPPAPSEGVASSMDTPRYSQGFRLPGN